MKRESILLLNKIKIDCFFFVKKNQGYMSNHDQELTFFLHLN